MRRFSRTADIALTFRPRFKKMAVARLSQPRRLSIFRLPEVSVHFFVNLFFLVMKFSECGPIGVFDSGYGGLTVLRDFQRVLPQYDYIYLGDNARAPYGVRSFELVYEFTRQAVRHLFEEGCPLVILACNTASAKALRSIQTLDLPEMDPDRRVLGVIRPTIELLPELTQSGHIGVLATPGTVNSRSYTLETEKLFPHMTVTEKACPMWVPLVENGEASSPGADYFVKKYIDEILAEDPLIDTLILGCTHYPMLYDKIRAVVPPHIKVVPQGNLVAESLKDYLWRHPEMERRLTRSGKTLYQTTEASAKFDKIASLFLNNPVLATQITL